MKMTKKLLVAAACSAFAFVFTSAWEKILSICYKPMYLVPFWISDLVISVTNDLQKTEG